MGDASNLDSALPVEDDDVAGGDVPVVGIGASAGGLEALQELFGRLPSDAGLAYVVITHRDPAGPNLLPELLRRETAVPVAEVTDGVAIEPDRVYVAPDRPVEIRKDRLFLGDAAPGDRRSPIDRFFCSLADARLDRAICVILSGTGTDGTRGMQSIKGVAGMAMVQRPESAKYSGMPASAIATGAVDYVLEPAEMPAQLVAYLNGPYLVPRHGAATPLVPDEPLQRIFFALRDRTGHDFSAYKPSTIQRRVARRMNVHQIHEPTEYVQFLHDHPHEIDLLYRELLIGVTAFFRNPDMFESLAGEPLRDLLYTLPPGAGFRAWVPGCATGEEVYSLAILVRECIATMDRPPEVRIFGTDVDREAIEVARRGEYPEGIAVDVPPARLEECFRHEDHRYRIRREVRDMVTLATQNVLADPPFTALDLVSCRNLLIYLTPDLQRRLLEVFHWSLVPRGLLVLGPSESIGGLEGAFEVVDARWKIFRRRESEVARRTLPALLSKPTRRRRGDAPTAVAAVMPTLAATVDRVLAARFAPTAVLVNDQGDIAYIHGRTGDLLEPSAGLARMNILEMARPGLRHELVGALRRVTTLGKDALIEKVRVETPAGERFVDLAVTRLREPEGIRGMLLVSVRDATPPVVAASSEDGDQAEDRSRVESLEVELRHTRESLQASVEEQQSANEELQSTNEELQSTNEELESSKEELQSLNEELSTVNTELRSKIEELTHTSDDMRNLLNSSRIATLFLDNDLRIRRFTDQAEQIIRVIESDVGRHVGDLAVHVAYESLVADCERVLSTLIPQEAELRTPDRQRFLMRIVPYRTAENVIDGLVITFDDITRIRHAPDERRFLENVVGIVAHPVVVLDADLTVVAAAPSFYRQFELQPKQVDDRVIFEIAQGRWDVPEMHELLEEVLPREKSIDLFEFVDKFDDRGPMTFYLNARYLEAEHGRTAMILVGLMPAGDR